MKKILCGILGIILILSFFTACGDTEPPTTTTTNNDFKKENLNDYVGYWYIDEQSMDFDKTNDDKWADVHAIEILEAYETEGERAISIKIYDGELLCPYYHWRIVLKDNSNIATVPKSYIDNVSYHLEFKDGQIIVSMLCDNELGQDKTVFTYKTSDSTAYEAIIDYNSEVFENYYKGYWYIYKTDEDPALVADLHIKSFGEGVLTFDYSYGDKHGDDVTAELRNGAARFLINDELTGVLMFDDLGGDITFYVAEMWDSSYGETVGRFVKYADNLPDTTYRPFMWRQRERTVMENGELKPYQYDESTATWLTFSKTDYETEREAVKEWLKEDLESIKNAMGEDYYEPTIYIAKYDMDNNKTEDFIVWIMHGGYTGTAGSPLSVMYFDGTKVIGEEYIAHFRLDADTLENEGNKQVGIFPYGKYWHDICVLEKMYVCDQLYK